MRRVAADTEQARENDSFVICIFAGVLLFSKPKAYDASARAIKLE